ncbi:GTP pyrophosphokinase [Rhizobium sp. SL42]|uniref:GTP pyrophosphokinase n=1 Tax=Rhizobium sp. SL42 TaxID=2806346 RepID=UPI001F32D903|nr:GTP pyrophosphokinase [Rhizobium sp. SL42]UJW74192.1 GTP pyrophosphokinase [Rhizobium sp. SL42]
MTKKQHIETASADLDGESEFISWLTANHQRYVNLKDAVISITTSLLTENHVDFLTVTGRAKDPVSALEKITRKGYDDPQSQMTDLAGIRVIVFLESDVSKVAGIIRNSFSVDEANSSNNDERLSTDQVGYRSTHFVCDLGENRCKLPEFQSLAGLKFEFQVRTVLQHAWAELSHDRNYKFSGKMPRHLERRLFLLAGLLETADQGFDDLAEALDSYVEHVNEDSAKGDLDIEVNSISLQSFIEKWASENNIKITPSRNSTPYSSGLLRELEEYGIKTLADLKECMPDNYADAIRDIDSGAVTATGLVRRMMYLHDPERFIKKVQNKWIPSANSKTYLKRYFSEELAKDIINRLSQNRGKVRRT